MNYKVDTEELKKDVAHIFHNGYACSESVIYALNKHFDFQMPDDAIAMSSGFPWGLGGGGCLCGATAGGAMCLGFVFGRRKPNDPCINKCFTLTEEFHDAFKKEFGATCCRILIRGLERDDPVRKEKCTKQVVFAVEIVANIIMRELSSEAV